MSSTQMPPCTTSSRAVLRCLAPHQLRIAGNSTPFSVTPTHNYQTTTVSPPYASSTNPFNDNLQKRPFLGCGDGEEGGVLSKVYDERRILGYSREQLFDVVAAVDLYHGFVPWCQRSEVLKRYSDGSFDAELEIGFKFLVESYISHVKLKRPQFVRTTATDSNLFDHLINIWEFNPGPSPGTCDLHFLVDFKFQSPLYRQVQELGPEEIFFSLKKEEGDLKDSWDWYTLSKS